MDGKKILLFAIVFLLGVASALFIPSLASSTIESPFSLKTPQERFSPSNTIVEDQIRVYKNGVYVSLEDQDNNDWLIQMDLDDPSWSTFTDTNSMDPVFDIEANTVRIKVPAEDLQVGDIISYQKGNAIIIHRIVVKDSDENGLYFILKGDNNPTNDPGKVRPAQILGKVVAIFY